MVTRHQQVHRNGKVPTGNSRLSLMQAPDKQEASGPDFSFTANDTSRHGCQQRMMLAVKAVGLGTMGSLVLNALAKKVLSERQPRSLPGTFEYLMVDAAAAQPDMDSSNFFQIVGGVDGSGTHPCRGRELFLTQRNYQQLRSTLNNRLLGLMGGDPDMLTQSPRRAVLIAGSGGTSGGSLYPAIGLLHDVAQDRHIEQPRVHVVLVGAEMPLRDKDRNVTIEQQQIVRATASDNLRRILIDMATDGYLQETRPDGTTFSIKASERVWSITVADQSSGFHDHATVADLGKMLAEALYLRFFTQAGAHLAERICDLRQIGVMALGTTNGRTS